MPIITVQDLPRDFSIGIVISRFNHEITQLMYDGALERLKELDITEEQITLAWVPGAVEIPLVAQTMASSGKFAAIVCYGAVIRGETTHYDYVCDQVSYGCQRVALDTGIPVIFGVLTTENHTQARDRLGGKKGHKAREAIDAAFEMISVLRQLKGLVK